MAGSNHPTFRVVIPARWGSTRLPGKALADLEGRPMIAWVVDVARAALPERVVVATDDERIAAVAIAAGAEAVVTGEHASGTDRVAAIAAVWGPDVRVLNVQGDAPLLDPGTVVAVARALDDPAVDVATASVPLRPAEQDDPHVVKVRGATFTRSPLAGARRHLGVYGFRNAALQRLAAAPPTADEQAQRLEQLRALALGLRFAVVSAPGVDGPDVDTPADLQAVRARLATAALRTHPTCHRTDSLSATSPSSLAAPPQEPSP